MSKVVNLFNNTPVPDLTEPNQSLIEVLRRALELAESGSLQSFTGTGFTSDGFRFSIYDTSKQTDYYQFLGALLAQIDEFKERWNGNDED